MKNNKQPTKTPDTKELTDLTMNFLNSAMTMKELRGMSDKEMEAIYASAYNMYNHGKFQQAEEIFQLLCQLDPYKVKYWMGLGASFHMSKEYSKALEAYSFAAMIDMKNPYPSFHAGDCLVQLKDYEHAEQAFLAAAQICEETKKHPEVAKQARALMEGLKKKSKK